MPETQYFAVIFSSELWGNDPEYAQAAMRMIELAERVPGFLSFESYRMGPCGVTISYWQSEQAIRAWRENPEHIDVQARGRESWYKRYTLRVARVVRESNFEAGCEGAAPRTMRQDDGDR